MLWEHYETQGQRIHLAKLLYIRLYGTSLTFFQLVVKQEDRSHHLEGVS